MGVPVITVSLESSNTLVEKEPVQYNLEIEVELRDIWEELIQDITPYTKIKVQTHLSIPTVKKGGTQISNFTVVDSFNVYSISDKKIIQNGYFEGVYDESRAFVCSVKVWRYELVPYIEGAE